jgi:hypothetical protein
MSKKRLQILFQSTSIFLEGEEDNLKSMIRSYTIAAQAGTSHQTIMWSDTYCICLQHVVGMLLVDIPADQRKQEEEDEPWRSSLRPDNEDEE